MLGWYRHHQKNTFGIVLHFLEFVCDLDVAERATVSDGRVDYFGFLATFQNDEEGFPVFTFSPFASTKPFMASKIAQWSEDQEQNRAKAIKAWKEYHEKGGS